MSGVKGIYESRISLDEIKTEGSVEVYPSEFGGDVEQVEQLPMSWLDKLRRFAGYPRWMGMTQQEKEMKALFDKAWKGN